MGRHKCEVIACLSSQMQCEFMKCYICTSLMASKFDLIWKRGSIQPIHTVTIMAVSSEWHNWMAAK